MTLAIISHPDCEFHFAGLGHPESPERVKAIQTALEAFPFKTKVNFYEAPLAEKDQLNKAHDADYVNWIFSIAPKEEMTIIDADTVMSPATLQAALRAAGAVIFAVDLVMQDKAMGFCFFNNVAVGIFHAFDQYHLERIAIVDFDVHHGNGTQNIFQKDPRVLYCSSFQYPFYPGYDEELNNKHLLPVPLPAGTDGATYREKVKAAWFDKILAFNPQLIFFSAGFDAHTNDPLAQLKLQKADYVWLTEQVAAIAQKTCGGKMISVLEGGYNLDALRECAPAHVNAMLL
jgi:acetoin utilization deacetylase AcuC-like enzyme